MMKRIAFLSITIVAFSMNSEARQPMTSPVSELFKVSGIRAEFLFNAMSKFESVPGLEGTSDCAMGTCTTSMKYVSCAKNMDEGPSQMFPGEMNQPFMTCSPLSTDGRGTFKNVSYRDNEGVRELRHSLVEITGKEFVDLKSKSITVKSVDCTAHAMNRDMDSIEIETTYECTIVK